MTEDEAKVYLKNSLSLSVIELKKLEIFRSLLLEFNSRYNLISKSTENLIWSRHILDCAQLIKLFDINSKTKLVDFGSGAGFPGIVLAICNSNPEFHVKLYEKSPIKRKFLSSVKKIINLNIDIAENVLDERIDADIVVARAFKKLDKLIKISREIVKIPHKLIILKGKNAQQEINNVSLGKNYRYNLVNSVTSFDSKIIVLDVLK
jgi:16S rRNA (guanine527-N7)-methyltransferase|tara:strand:+ start:1694 stop:2311 length:618 start_codon:yes stop_codon:yes gene_type:complete